ncbi:MAG TPA: phosphocholine cytidylyltransferase family protein [Methylomirabilota bacterium]|nr:phosphocholine cytidylyltransferase family protein [Methylomirabilota bacterium]
MKAIILAAGIGRRLSPLTDRTPKCLLDVGGKSLLERMLSSLSEVGIKEAVLVVGHLKELIRERIGTRCAGLQARYIENPEYSRGSIRSLWHARGELREESLVMDADVLFPTPLLHRLLSAPDGSALCLDEAFTDSGEEMKLFVQGDRVVAISRKAPARPYDPVGEGVGFMKCSAPHGHLLATILEEMVRDGADGDYENAIDRLLRQAHVGWVAVNGLPWTEIDFADDLRRAQEEILPRIESSGAGDRGPGAANPKSEIGNPKSNVRTPNPPLTHPCQGRTPN